MDEGVAEAQRQRKSLSEFQLELHQKKGGLHYFFHERSGSIGTAAI